jgi:DNA modification methylase
MQITPYEKNAKKHPEAQLRQLALSLREYGWRQPIVVDKDNVIIVGHGRYMAYQKYPDGIAEPWVVKADDLTPEQVKGYRLMDNKSNESDWDMGLVVEELKELDEANFPIELTGFDSDLLIYPEDKDDEIPDSAPTRAQLGDIWLLGEHRVMCGDSTVQEDVEKLMGGVKADMVFTDPPYGVSYADKNKYLNSIAPGNRIQTPIKNDHRSIESLQDEVIYPAFCRIKEVLSEEASFYITAPQGGDLLMMMMMMMTKAGLPLRHMIVWVKNNHVLGRTDYNYKHEPILYGWVDTHNFYGGGQHRFSTWEIAKPHKSDLHPTMKPIELIVNAILNSSLEGGRILDLFLGSGSTLIGAEKTGRICYGMELDPKYMDVIIKRWEDFTGKIAVKV